MWEQILKEFTKLIFITSGQTDRQTYYSEIIGPSPTEVQKAKLEEGLAEWKIMNEENKRMEGEEILEP